MQPTVASSGQGYPVTRTIRYVQAAPGTATGPVTYVQASQPGATTIIRPATSSPVVMSAPTPVYTQAGGLSASRPSLPLSGSVTRVVMPAGTSGLSGSVQRVVLPAQVAAAAPQQRPHTLAGPAYTQGAYEQKHADDPQLQNLKEIRKSSGLKHIPVGAGLKALQGAAVEGKLTREQFIVAYQRLLQQHDAEPPTDEICNAVFDLFDRDDNHVCDMMEIICGISLLCAGTEDEKIHAVFDVFDVNGDGFVSMEEMFTFLTAVFKVVLTPNVMAVMNTMGVSVDSPEDLATVTAQECFKTCDLNGDGKLSVAEFKNWFYAPRNDPTFLFSPVRKLLH